jgi:hypothetical protein
MPDTATTAPLSHRQILLSFGSRQRLLEDLVAGGSAVTYSAVQQWELRDHIPAAHWPALVSVAAARGDLPQITQAALEAGAAKNPQRRRGRPAKAAAAS